MSKYMLLIYGDSKRWADVTDEETGAIMGEYFAYTQSLIDAGCFIAGDPLQPADTAKVVASGGVVTDGPFADTTEHLGGYYIIDVPAIGVACEWAGNIPGVTRGLDRIEVRAVMDLPPEMGS